MNNLNIYKYKPDFDIVRRRWTAYWQHEIVDRPPILCTLTKPGFEFKPGSDYRDKLFGDMQTALQNARYNQEGMIYPADTLPSLWMSMSTHEFATYLGADLVWPKGEMASEILKGGKLPDSDTNWAHKMVNDWEDILPLKIDENNYWWKRIQEFYKLSVDMLDGYVIPYSLDFHTNMDLLMSLRGDAELCMDLVDCPEMIDKGMESVRKIFQFVWERIKEVGKMEEIGYWFDGFSEKSVTVLACDFICMIGKDMFRRWALPTLEFEASLVDNVIFHWDGPGALKHTDDLLGVDKIHTFSYVPSPGEGHFKYLELYKKVQKAGKSILYEGTPEEIKAVFKELKPHLTMYKTSVGSEREFYELDTWMKNNI